MDVHALGAGDDDHSGSGTRYSRQGPWRTYPRSGSTSLDRFEGHSSETEVESLLSPSWHNLGEYQEQNHRRRHGRSMHRRSQRFVHANHDESGDSEAESSRPPNQRRNVTFSLSQSRAGNPGNSPSHTSISGGTQSSVGGSQNIITDHHVYHGPHDVIINTNGSNVHIHIHNHGIGDSNSKIWAVFLGLFGRGDSMVMRCT
ncbi:hypothetical protein BT96DRAFT_915937 [Gymnopus androsaceus JB14]|uniref:Uncharacterized protein n=1 Tax=Gymnopus androsaceus JB14 TaxID=1447944 RepID=A0A6A4I1U2_9AGAR|nr:hypothetical protein BT96DRAFT_915937 [Gymnopus androsaceus JB14]